MKKVIFVALVFSVFGTQAYAATRCNDAARDAVEMLIAQNSDRSGESETVESVDKYHDGVGEDIYTVKTTSDVGTKIWTVVLDPSRCQINSIRNHN